MRSLGDVYVKAGPFPNCITDLWSFVKSKSHLRVSEFRRHQKIDNPLHIIGFLSQWKLYLDDLPSSPTDRFTGRKLDPTLLEKVFAY